GVLAAAAPIVLFFDDDDVADPNLLLRHVEAHERNPEEHVAVLGYTTWGGHSSCKRSLLRHGLFNPTFRFGSEDIELGHRLSRRGLEVVFARDAVSYMNRPVTLD